MFFSEAACYSWRGLHCERILSVVPTIPHRDLETLIDRGRLNDIGKRAARRFMLA
jgi:hypothetical protein